MKRNFATRWTALASLAALLTMTIAARGDDPTPAPTDQAVTVVVQQDEGTAAPQATGAEARGIVVVQGKANPGSAEARTITVDVDVVKPGEYWLGIICTPLEDELLQAQLDIQHGVVVKEVVQDSPAAKAGLQPQDILLQVGDQPLTDLKVLVETTEKSKEQPLTLTFLRKGERQTVEVTPAKRPATPPTAATAPDKEAADEWKLLQDSLRMHWVPPAVAQDGTAPDGTKMLFLMPGFVLPEQAKNFPKDLEVTMVKKGEEPLKITVKRGDDTWEVDATSLDKLPEDIRPYVAQLLHGGVSVAVGSGGVSWSSDLPQSLILPKLDPEVLKKSLKVAPKIRMELRGLAEKLPAEVREKIDAELKDAQDKLEEAQSNIPTETLDKIQQELKELREQIEKLRAERAEKAAEQKPAAEEPAHGDRQ
jgi:hypothetical protein